MKHSNLIYAIGLVLLLFTLNSCKNELDPLAKANSLYANTKYIAYQTDAFFPIQNSSLSRRVTTHTEVLLKPDDPVGFHYCLKSKDLDRIYTDNSLQLVSHKLKTIRVIQPDQFKDSLQYIRGVKNNFVRRMWTPFGLLENKWEYLRDSIYENVHLTNYTRIENTGMNGAVKIVTEQHIFIDDEGLIKRFERRNLNDDVVVQNLIFDFSNYRISQEIELLEYSFPSDYKVEFGRPNRAGKQ